MLKITTTKRIKKTHLWPHEKYIFYRVMYKTKLQAQLWENDYILHRFLSADLMSYENTV